jgi:hypothetical protein
VRDDATPKGAKYPWVVLDDDDLLVSERAWWVRVP